MGLFGYTIGKESEHQKTPVENTTVKEEVEKSKSYTEHVAEIKYADGETEEIRFDGLVKQEEAIVLKNYTGYRTGRYSGFSKEAIATIPYANLKKLETVERIDREMEYTVTKTKELPVDEVEE